MKFGKFVMDEVDRDGAEFPQMTHEEFNAGGTDWHFFPNQVFLQSPTGLLGYRARPNGDDPDSCIWDVYSLQRFGPGKEPKDVKVEWSMDHADEEFWGKILCQDYANMGEVQKGMKSRGFTRALTNPEAGGRRGQLPPRPAGVRGRRRVGGGLTRASGSFSGLAAAGRARAHLSKRGHSEQAFVFGRSHPVIVLPPRIGSHYTSCRARGVAHRMTPSTVGAYNSIVPAAAHDCDAVLVRPRIAYDADLLPARQ